MAGSDWPATTKHESLSLLHGAYRSPAGDCRINNCQFLILQQSCAIFSSHEEDFTMAQMNVSIPQPMKNWCETQVKDGRYSTASDYIRDLIRKDQDKRQAVTAMQTLIDEAEESGISPNSLEEIFAIAKEKH